MVGLGPWPEAAGAESWATAQASVEPGVKLGGAVLCHRPFGFFVTLDDFPDVPGLVQITDYRPEGKTPRYGADGSLDPPYPEIGTKIDAEVIWLRDDNRQILMRYPP